MIIFQTYTVLPQGGGFNARIHWRCNIKKLPAVFQPKNLLFSILQRMQRLVKGWELMYWKYWKDKTKKIPKFFVRYRTVVGLVLARETLYLRKVSSSHQGSSLSVLGHIYTMGRLQFDLLWLNMSPLLSTMFWDFRPFVSVQCCLTVYYI